MAIPTEAEHAAHEFISWAIQEWEQPDEQRIAAVQATLNVAGFNARATCWPVFRGIWPKPCEGLDAEEASKWLRELTDTLTLVSGHVEDEIDHVQAAIEKRIKSGG